jgi:hypothetical protein
MGVEYEHYLIPEDPEFKPNAEQLGRLVTVLYGSDYVNKSEAPYPGVAATFGLLSPEYQAAKRDGCVVQLERDTYARFRCPCSVADMAALGDRDFRLIWRVEDLETSGLKYPLRVIPDESAYYDLELHVAKDYVYHTSSIIEPFDRLVTCRCGQPLEYSEDWESFDEVPVFCDMRIHRFCPGCSAPSRPQDYTIRLKNGRTGEDLGPRPGGATYLFAILVDCGKCYDGDAPVRASDEFLRICQEAIGMPLFQIGDFSGC